MSCQPHYPWFDLLNNIWGWVHNTTLLIVQLPTVSCYFIPLSGPIILLRTLFSNALSLCSSLNARDQTLHPYKTTRITTVMYVLTFGKKKHAVSIFGLKWQCWEVGEVLWRKTEGVDQTQLTPSAFLSLTLGYIHPQLPNIVTSAMKMETVCFSEIFASNYERIFQNPKYHNNHHHHYTHCCKTSNLTRWTFLVS
jgi:hypothetical protein